MDFLRLLAAEATQTFTYLCSGSVAWFDVDTNDLTNAISLIGANDHVFDTENFNERQVIHDGCQVGTSLEKLFCNYWVLHDGCQVGQFSLEKLLAATPCRCGIVVNMTQLPKGNNRVKR